MQNISSFYSGKRVLITGNTGFKGSWLTKILLSFGAEVSGYSLKPEEKKSLYEILKLNKSTNTKISDIRDFRKLDKFVKKEEPEIVFHLAAQPIVSRSYKDPKYNFETNVMGMVNLLDSIKDTSSVKSVVLITSDKVYSNKEQIWGYRETDEIGGHDPYSASKSCAELVANSYIKSFFNLEKHGNDHNVLLATARAGNVIGGGDWSKDRIVPDIVKNLLEKNSKLIIRSPNAIRPWQHVLDPIYGYALLGKKLYEGDKKFSGAWNFAPMNENFITVEALVKKFIEHSGKGEYEVQNQNMHETTILKLDSSKANEYLNWKPKLNIDNAVRMICEWHDSVQKGENKVEEVTNMQIDNYLNLQGVK